MGLKPYLHVAKGEQSSGGRAAVLIAGQAFLWSSRPHNGGSAAELAKD
jgi:hypothetical protein